MAVFSGLGMTSDVALDFRVARDLAKRSIPGIFIYPIFWPILAYGSNFANTHQLITFGVTLLMVLCSILRFYHVQSLRHLAPEKMTFWHQGFYFWIFPQVASWGVLFAYAMFLDNAYFLLFMAFSASGIVAGGVNTFAPKLKLSLWFLVAVLGPPIIVGFLLTEHWVIALLCVTYMVYMAGLAKNQNHEYWISIENEQVLAQQSRTDALTKLDNRRFFDEKLNELVHLSSRNHEQLAVLVIDCDNFKTINDRYGHDVGDKALQHVAKLIKKSLPRTTDVCARYGGEEFSALLPGTDVAGATLVAERIRRNLEESTLILEQGVIAITVSIGITAHEIGNFQQDLPRKLFREADKALYLAKQNGRNRCVCFQEEVKIA